VVAYDFGVKRNILRMLAERGCKVTVVPAQTTAAEVLALNPDGVFLSNGPGDPEPCDYAIAAAKVFMEKKIPLFGICLGHQIMGWPPAPRPEDEVRPPRRQPPGAGPGQAGHDHLAEPRFRRGPNTLPANCRVTHVSLFDGSLQGFARTDKPAFCFQGHPEASPARLTSLTCLTASSA
jgi:carbamoyl-phosphate synthase small subunit